MDMSASSDMFVFSNRQDTSLYSLSWTPKTSGQYAGTCIFLVFLAIISRLLVAFKVAMERKWLSIALNRRYVVVAGKKQEADSSNSDPDSISTALLTTQGAQENVKVVRRVSHGPQPWRFSVDLPRALLFLCIIAVNYLLMLAVMTMNIGYFLSILAGAFIGELVVGRHIEWGEH